MYVHCNSIPTRFAHYMAVFLCMFFFATLCYIFYALLMFVHSKKNTEKHIPAQLSKSTAKDDRTKRERIRSIRVMYFVSFSLCVGKFSMY